MAPSKSNGSPKEGVARIVAIGADQEAYVDTVHYNGTLWDAVFVTHRDGSRELKALVASVQMAELVAQALNDTRSSGQVLKAVQA